MCALNDGTKTLRGKSFFFILFGVHSGFPSAFWMAHLNQSVWLFSFLRRGRACSDQNYQHFATSGAETSAAVALRPCNEPQRRAVMAFP